VLVRPVPLPGREARFAESPVDQWSAMLDLLVVEVLPLLHPRAVVYGHSFGALLAYEACVLAERAGIRPMALCAAAADGPDAAHRPLRVAQSSDQRLVEELTQRTGDDRLARLPTELHPVVLPAIRADLTLYDDYRPAEGAAVTAPLLALCSAGDEAAAQGAAAWQRRASGRFALASVNGGHFFHETAPDEVLTRILAFTAATDSERPEYA
jgi:surfactin synthase thioesterase subunit